MRLLPQLAKNLEVSDLSPFILSDEWVIEQKLDGHRIFLAAGPGGVPQASTRNGTPYTRKLPRSITDFRFPEGEWVLDGEFLDGRLWCFDMPLAVVGDTPMHRRPLDERRAALETFLQAVPSPFRLTPQARTRDEKVALASKALGQGFEGLVLKKKSSPYRSGGRTEEWLKLKFVSTVDVVVTDVRGDGKDSVGYAVYRDGALAPIGRASLIGKEKAGKVAVGDVLEVRYLYVGADGRLYQPTILCKRDDKRPDECTDEQLRHVNKTVLETL